MIGYQPPHITQASTGGARISGSLENYSFELSCNFRKKANSKYETKPSLLSSRSSTLPNPEVKAGALASSSLAMILIAHAIREITLNMCKYTGLLYNNRLTISSDEI